MEMKIGLDLKVIRKISAHATVSFDAVCWLDERLFNFNRGVGRDFSYHFQVQTYFHLHPAPCPGSFPLG
jgi:hypothetical protein